MILGSSAYQQSYRLGDRRIDLGNSRAWPKNKAYDPQWNTLRAQILAAAPKNGVVITKS